MHARTMSLFIYFAIIITNLSFFPLGENRVCKSLDVRNTPEHISEFRDCRVIEGHLQVVLMERADDSTDYYNSSFTQLHEITDYLIVYRVMGLTSLDIIFPNLVSIKGNQLFFGYALVLYEVQDLEEIGLIKLRNIGRGNVKIDNCPRLCYVDTLNWQALGASALIYDRISLCENEFCPNHCRDYCWNNYECQSLNKSKCHDLCIGCSQNHSPKHCLSCKYFNNSGTCVKSCPNSKLVNNHSSRCILPKECISRNGTWSIFNKSCVRECPDWFKRNSKGKCIPSEVKICEGIKINNHFDLDQMAGCTHINGPLEITLTGYIDNSYLEKSLGMIVSISDYLKIWKSHSITTLSFLKKLKEIKGMKLWSRFYALFVAENSNLQKLFNENVSVAIENGEAFFQDNPHLCDSEIDKIEVTSNYSNTNGYQTSCNLTDFVVNITENNSTNVTLSWNVINKPVLGYTIFYKVKTEENSTAVKLKEGFVGKDGMLLEEDGWNSIFTKNNTITLKHLIPFTHYEYYLKIAFVSKTIRQTPIYSFRTASGDPSEPIDFELESSTETSITLKWKPPLYTNGNLSHYKLAVYLQEDFLSLLTQRNYCLHPFVKQNCVCPKKDEIKIFRQEGTSCTGDGDNYCNSKTIYYTDSNNNKIKIEKRSIAEYYKGPNYEEYTIKANSRQPTFKIYGLKPFTLYTFYLGACNHKENNETDHCGGTVMESLRTLKRKNADSVSNITIEVKQQSVEVSWIKPQQPNSVILAYKIEYKRINSLSTVKCYSNRKSDCDICYFKIEGLDEGKYSIRVWAVSLAGDGEESEWKYFRIYTVKDGKSWSWIYILLGFVGFLVILGLFVWYRYKTRYSVDNDNLIVRMSVEENNENGWKLDNETVEIIKDLSENSVGILYRRL